MLAIFTNLITLLYLVHLQDTQNTSEDTLKSPTNKINTNLNKFKNLEVTAVIRDFEHYETAVPETTTKLLQHPNIGQVVIVSDVLPYPPLTLPKSDKVNLISLDVRADKLYNMSKPMTYIKSEYTLILPDGVEVNTEEEYDIEHLVHVLKTDTNVQVHLVAFPLDTATTARCLEVSISLKTWVLTYGRSANEDIICDAIHGQFGIFLRSSDLALLPAPFTAPMHKSLFIQTALQRWKVRLIQQPIFNNFHTLFHDPHANWKHRSDEYSRLKKMYKLFGIKLVRQESGQEEWHGCEKDTERCFGTVVADVPEYIYQKKWTPPCCLRNLRLTARHVFSTLEQQGVRYWLEGGSLLGAARTGDIIPWDYDVDIGIYKDDINKSPELLNCVSSPVVDKLGFVWEHAPEGEFYRVQFSETNRLHVDIFPFYSKNGNMTKDTWFKTHRQDTEFPEHYLNPLSKIKFIGIGVSAPNNWKDFLELKFGKHVIDTPRYPNYDHPL